MPLIVSQVKDISEFDEIIPMDYDAWQTPYNPQLKHFRPVFKTREESIEYTKARDIKRFQEADPNCFMLKVTDDVTNEVVGWANWVVNDPEKSHGEEGEMIVANWHPEGSEEREFAELFINGLWGFLSERVTRKHMGILLLLCTPLVSV